MPVTPNYFGLQNFSFPIVTGGSGTGTGTIAATNNGNGTVTVTITSGDDGTVSIVAAEITGGGIGEWATLGSIVVSGGTGQTTFTVDPATYIVGGYMGTATYGNPVYVVVTTTTSGWLSYIRAIQAFYIDNLSAANFPGGVKPGVYFAEGSGTKWTTNANLVPPYIVIEDVGAQPSPPPGHSEPWAVGLSNAIIVGGFKLNVYYTDLGEADTALWATMWNGAEPVLKQGLAFCQLNMRAPLYSLPLNCVPTRMWRGYAGFQYENARVHVAEQSFDLRIYLASQGM